MIAVGSLQCQFVFDAQNEAPCRHRVEGVDPVCVQEILQRRVEGYAEGELLGQFCVEHEGGVEADGAKIIDRIGVRQGGRPVHDVRHGAGGKAAPYQKRVPNLPYLTDASMSAKTSWAGRYSKRG